MKDEVSKWNVHNGNINTGSSDHVESLSNEVVKYVSSLTLKESQRNDRCLATAFLCDSNAELEPVEIPQSFLLVRENVQFSDTVQIHTHDYAMNLVRLNEFAPPSFLSVKTVLNAPFSSSYSLMNVCRGHYENHKFRQTVCSVNLTKFLLIWLQIGCAVLLCNINVSVAVVVSDRHGAGISSYKSDYINSNADSNSRYSGSYTPTWVVQTKRALADEVARDHNFNNLGEIFYEHHHFEHKKISKRSILPATDRQTLLEKDKRVVWARQQQVISRHKRDFIHSSQVPSNTMTLVDAVPLNDSKWPQMWYLNRGGDLDMNVIPVWKQGITGKGIVVTILDDGLEWDHPDISNDYDPKASFDVNGNDEDPMPRYDLIDSNRHGTRCAGEVAATANNSICAVGIAYGARVGGVRMLDGDVTDAVEARALSLNPQHIDIYSASWGPDDDGKTVDGPGELASRAFIEGVTKGRNGKGSIFIWASGNGGRDYDNCNCDGYTNSIWTLSISSATEKGNVPWYSEECSSTLATTYSSGAQGEKQIVTTDLHHTCTVSHTGTSASAPLAAGIAALVLESNPNLTWRDMQHIVVRTAKPYHLHNATWARNGVGRYVSHSFGYGLMDAAAMVKLARTWKTVPEQQRCEINAPHVDKYIQPNGSITLQLTVKHCMSVNFLEHVQAKITLTSQKRGDIHLYLISPAGTRVTLLKTRIHDMSRSGFNQWPFMSVHTWGESPHGYWQLEIHNEGRSMAQITQWDLIFYGTETPAQIGDPNPPSTDLIRPYNDGMDHNKLDYSPQTSRGQWFNEEQMRQYSHVSGEGLNNACLKATIDQKCIECLYPTFIFEGHCYQQCPLHSYPVVMHQFPANLYDSAIVRRRDNDSYPITTAHDATDNFMLPRTCAICDKSCLSCFGPLISQCSQCYPGSQLRMIAGSNESFCYAFSERSANIAQNTNVNITLEGDSNAKSTIKAVQLLLSVLLLLLIAVSLIIWQRDVIRTHLIVTWCRWLDHESTTYRYDVIALLPEYEPSTKEPNYSDNIKTDHKCSQFSTVDNDSDNESDVDIFDRTKL